MSDTRFYVGEEPIIVNGELSNYPNTTFGETSTFEFYIKNDVNLTATSGWGSDWGYNWGSVDDEYETAEERYNRLKDYLNYAGYASTNRTLSSVYYSEPGELTHTPVETTVIRIEPGMGVDEARGVWGVIVGGDDTTQIFGAMAKVSLEVFVIAEVEAPESDEMADIESQYRREVGRYSSMLAPRVVPEGALYEIGDGESVEVVGQQETRGKVSNQGTMTVSK